MNLKDSHPKEILHLGLSKVEFSQLQNLLHHVKHIEMEARPEEKSMFINMQIINNILEKLKILGFQEGAKSDDFFFNNNNPY